MIAHARPKGRAFVPQVPSVAEGPGPWYLSSTMRVQVKRQAVALLVVELASPTLACQRDAAADQGVGKAVASSAASEHTAAPASRARFDESAFSLSIASKSPAQRNQPTELTIALAAKAPYHVNQEYPHRFKVLVTHGLTTSSTVIQRDAEKVTPDRLELLIPISVGQDAPFSLEGEMSFSLCTDEKCLMEKRRLSTTLEVH